MRDRPSLALAGASGSLLLVAVGLLGGCGDARPEGASRPVLVCPAWYPDADGDGYGDADAAARRVCAWALPGHVLDGGDCDDADPEVHPGAREICDAWPRDDDCDGLRDDEDPDRRGRVETWSDRDGDGHGDMNEAPELWCEVPPHRSADARDCDDSNLAAWLGAAWAEGGTACTEDADGDGWGAILPFSPAAEGGTDCDDGDAAVHPTHIEVLGDGVDQDCDGEDLWAIADDFETGAFDPALWEEPAWPVEVDLDTAPGSSYSLWLANPSALVSVPIDTASCPELTWSYLGKTVADQGGFLLLQYHDGSGWHDLDRWTDDEVDDLSYVPRGGPVVDPGAYAPKIRIRLVNLGAGAYTSFHLADFSFGCPGPDVDGDGRVEQLDCDDSDPLHWSDCGTCVDGDGDGRGTGCDLGTDCQVGDPSVYTGAPDPVDGRDRDCDGFDGPLLSDDFEAGLLDPTVWASVHPNAGVEREEGLEGEYTEALHFQGPTSDAVTRPLDTTSCAEVTWSYRGKRSIYPPEPGEQLALEYDAGAGWVEIDAWDGTGGIDGRFVFRSGAVADPGIIGPSVQFRLVSSGPVDTSNFYVDELVLGCPVDEDGDGRIFDCDHADPLHWSDCGLCVDADLDGYGADCDLGGDCDDGDPTRNPGAADPPGDGVDSDCSGVDGVGLYDDFETGAVMPGAFAALYAEASVVFDYVTEKHVLELEDGVALSQPVDTSDCEALSWRYRGIRDWQTYEWERLEVQLWDGAAWEKVDIWEGVVARDATFLPRAGVVVEPRYFHPAFQLRLVGTTSLGGFLVDAVELSCGPDGDGDGAPDTIDCAPSDPWHFGDCGLCLDDDLDGYGVDCDAGIDCDEADPTVNPGAADPYGDGRDDNCDHVDGVGLYDGFEAGEADPWLWFDVDGSYWVSGRYHASGGHSMRLGGHGGFMESRPFDTSGCETVFWSYAGKRGPVIPDPGDSLELRYDDGSGWVTADRWVGENILDPGFSRRQGLLTDPGALWSGFRVRLEVVGDDHHGDFYIDDVRVVCGGPDGDGDGYPEAVDCDDTDATIWWTCR